MRPLTLTGLPDAPVIQKDLTRVTAVSVNLVWLSMFDGGSIQTFTVLHHKEGSLNLNVSLPVSDPGYGKLVSLHVDSLRELTKYIFIVRSKNDFGRQSVESVEEVFMTLGELK